MRTHGASRLVCNPQTYIGALHVVFGAEGNGVEAVGQKGVGSVYNGLLDVGG